VKYHRQHSSCCGVNPHEEEKRREVREIMLGTLLGGGAGPETVRSIFCI